MLLISIAFITIGIIISSVEHAVISLEDENRLKQKTINKIEKFKRNPLHFSFGSLILKFFLFSLGLIILMLSANEEILSLIVVAIFSIFAISLHQILKKFSTENPILILRTFEPFLFLLSMSFSFSFLFHESFVKKIVELDLNLAKRKFEFLLSTSGQGEILDENQMLKNVLEFKDKTVREIMVPRTRVVALDINAPREKVIKVVLNEGYSRLPVYKDNIDNIIGIVYAKDLINYIEEPNLFVLYDLLRPAYFVPETKNISELLRELQKNKIHMAIVVDEYGAFKGIVTLEDILEEIVGEIHDEYDKVEKNYEVLKDGSIIADAGMLISDFNKKFSEDIPEGTDYESIGGFVSKIAGKIPNENERIRYKNLVFEVTRRTKQKITELKITREKEK
jgi:CBS domain containing-hemolysin-like protein